MKVFWLLPLSARDFVRAVLVSLGLSFGFCVLLARYWRFFHLDTPGNGVGLLFIVLPIGALVGSILSLAANVYLRARPVPAAVASWAGVLLFVVLLASAFSLELMHTRAARYGEGIGAGDLTPFFRSLIPAP